MRIGIDGHVLGKNIGGVERFVRELVDKLPEKTPQHKYIVFVTKQEYAKLSAESKFKDNVEYVALMSANPIIERLLLLPWLVYKHQLDALLVQRLAPWFCGSCQLIATIHDLTPIKFAESYKGLSNKLVRLLTKNTIKRASLILTPTNAIKTEIEEYCSKVKAPIVAFYNGVDTCAFKQVDSDSNSEFAEQNYLLTVGAIESRKNLETILNALILIKQLPDIKLRIVGSIRDQAYYQEIQAKIKTMNIANQVQHMGFLSESELISLYQNASVFITASRDEGFNIPPLEAMACGVPVVCSNIPVHAELFTGAARFFEPENPADLAKQIDAVIEAQVKIDRLKENGYQKVGEFTWQRTAENVASALKTLDS